MMVNVLGTGYEIIYGNVDDYPGLKEGDGYCDFSVKQIVVRDMLKEQNDPNSQRDLQSYRDKVTRHELVHAFLYESGLDNSSWARDEEIVDWVAIQFPKLAGAMEQAGVYG